MQSNTQNQSSSSNLGKVLIIDDNPGILLFLEEILQLEGFEVGTALNGSEALESISRIKFDLIICDIDLPGETGFEIVGGIRRELGYENTPILMLSAYSDLSNRLKSLNSGANYFLSKPFANEELITILKRLMNYTKEIEFNYAIKAELSTEISSEAHRFRQRIELLINNFENDKFPTCKQLAEALGMSTNTLNRHFRNHLNTTCKNYCRKKRLNKAKILLAKHAGNISEIAQMLDYSNITYFSVDFKKEFGISPLRFQKTQENNQN